MNCMNTRQLLQELLEAERTVAGCVAAVMPQIERAVELIAARLEQGGRWFNVGAGTSGRIGALDAAELPPTFGVERQLVTAILAGGRDAMFDAREGAEDDAAAGARDLTAAGLCAADVVVGLAASGTTPYVIGALEHARRAGALTVSVICTPNSPLASIPEIAIVAATGPEVLSGSTRLKAGSAQKLVMNLLSTAVMARRGLIVRGEMVAMRSTNAKLRLRAVRIVTDLLQIDGDRARQLLEAAAWDLPVALVSGRHRESPAQARERLALVRGNVARALGDL